MTDLDRFVCSSQRVFLLLGPPRVTQSRRILTNTTDPWILDVGCGNHSPRYFKTGFPGCHYVGVDQTVYSNTPDEMRMMDRFIEADLEVSELEEVPDRSFDLIVLSHVLEHLRRGLEVLRVLRRKLRDGGIFFLAFPNPESVNFPHRDGSLNFYDDPTHVTLVDESALVRLLREIGAEVVYIRTTRRPVHLCLMLGRIAAAPLLGPVMGGALWDLYGFERVVVARAGPAASPAT